VIRNGCSEHVERRHIHRDPRVLSHFALAFDLCVDVDEDVPRRHVGVISHAKLDESYSAVGREGAQLLFNWRTVIGEELLMGSDCPAEGSAATASGALPVTLLAASWVPRVALAAGWRVRSRW